MSYDMLYNRNSNYDLNSQSKSNYYGTQIKEGLPFFQKNKLESTLRNNYINNDIMKRGNNNLVSNGKIDTSDIEAKKIIEREMYPYLNLMKKELNLKVEQFNKTRIRIN